jgi:Transposase IS116/IS110/IS902 family
VLPRRRPSRSKQHDRQIQQLGQTEYPETQALLKVHGVGYLTTPTLVLPLGSKERFGRSRDVGCYLGLRPRRSQSGDHEPQLGITHAGNAYLRSLVIECSNHILRPHGRDSALRQWGLRLAARGGKQAKSKAVVAVARKLAVLLHHLWSTQEPYMPFLRTSSLRDQHVYPLRRHRVPMTASRLRPSRPNDRWQHRLSSRTPTGTELASRQLIRVRIETRWRATKPRTTTRAKAL